MVNGNANACFQLDLSAKRYYYMKCRIIALLMFLGSLQAFSQQEYFIYLQENNNQPFYVRISNKIYSSAASGYIIISKLPDSTCSIVVGFPKNVFPEQQFNIPVNRKDGGFVLTNFGDKGWGLLNLQTLAVIMNSNTEQEKKKPEITGTRRNDPFSLLLSNAVNDTAVLYTAIRPSKPPPTIAVISINDEKKKDSIIIVKKDSIATAKRNNRKKGNAAIVKVKPLKNIVTAPVKTNRPKLDTIAIAKRSAPKNDTLAIAQKKPPVKKDTIRIAKNNRVKNKISVPLKKNEKKADTLALEKSSIPKNDTLAVTHKKLPIKKDTASVSKIKPRKNKNVSIQKETIPKIKDSTGLVKNAEAKKDTTTIASAKSKTDSDTYKINNPPPNQLLQPRIHKAAELLTDTSYIAVFIDELEEKNDTIRISIPFNETITLKKEERQPENEFTKTDSIVAKPIKDSTRFFETAHKEDSIIKKNNKVIPVTDTASETPKPKLVMINSDCKTIAWDSDIDKLRIKMLLVKTNEEKIILAKKIYTQKCFTVKQVRALSELFTTDEGRYKWLDAVYSFVSDSTNFSSLADILKEEYYLNRFKAMLRK
jgi:Domain of unknown function (DUF4476)